MALFCDGPISDAADLQRYENAILSVASAESIDIGAKITMAQEDLANEILLFLIRRRPYRDYAWGTQQDRDLKDVVVTDPLRPWHIHKTLSLVYRDAYNNQLNNRYLGKWTEYEQLAQASALTYFQIGVGLVANPVPKAGAPSLSIAVGAGSGGMFYVAATWVSGAGGEGAPSESVQLSTSAGQQLVATVSEPPAGVTGWNVYVGASPATLALQNPSPLATSSSWTMTSGPNSGAALPSGQKPTWYVVDERVIERG
jgi:hypothetical protein